jgi:predicted ester cyclase
MPRSLASRIKAANAALMVEGNLDSVGEFFAPGYIAHVTGEDMALGHAGIQKVITMYRRAFGDMKVDVEILIEANDRVAWQRTIHGTHQGEFKGFPATHRSIIWRDMVVSRFGANDLIAEDWIITDLAERLLLARKK